MAQFDFYINTNRKTKKYSPFLVDIQSSVLEDISTTIVVPLGKLPDLQSMSMSIVTPEIDINAEQYLFLFPQIASVPKSILKKQIGNISEYRGEMIAAMELSFTGS